MRLAALVAFALCATAADGGTAQGPSIVVLSTATSRPVATARVDAEPTRVAYGDGAVWAVTPGDGTVLRIVPGSPVQRRTFRGEPYDVATGSGQVWIPRHDSFDLLGVDWPRGVRRSGQLGGPQLAVAYGFGAVWTVAADGALRRIDPSTLRVTGSVGGVSFSSEGFEPKIAVGRDALWISDAVRRAVIRVDPRRLRIISVVPHGGNGVAVLGAQVWSTDGSFAWRISGGPVRRLKTGSGPLDVTAGGGAIWVANRFAKTVAKVDPVHARVVTTLHLPERPSALAYGTGRLAVALF